MIDLETGLKLSLDYFYDCLEQEASSELRIERREKIRGPVRAFS